MLDFKIVLLIFGVVFLLLAVTRKVIQKQRNQAVSQGKSTRPPVPVVRPRMDAEQFKRSWKGLSYLMLLAAAGNLYMLYNSLKGALETQSYVLWIDSIFCLAAIVIAVLIWRVPSRNLVIAYLVVMIIPIMFFMSTGHSMDGIIRLFPLVLVYFAIRPVWEYLEEQASGSAQNG